jgi:uncharacterized membrane protein (DUF2068 family)
MTSSDHNRTLGILHSLIGLLVLCGLIIAATLEAQRHLNEIVQRTAWMLYLLPLPLLQLLMAYGLFTRRPWGRFLALLFSLLYMFIFPLGTLLAAYTWYFLQSQNGRELYKHSGRGLSDAG